VHCAQLEKNAEERQRMVEQMHQVRPASPATHPLVPLVC
jgi:hypothetical protein